jgi:hypothetical protein
MKNALPTYTATEKSLIGAYEDAIMAVSSVERYITSAHATQLDRLEAEVGMVRADELREVARRRMGLA